MIFDPSRIANKAKNKYLKYCDGYSASADSPGTYVLGLVLEATTVPLTLSHTGSSLLDEINAFDKSEVENTYIGQINMITVSSYCGLTGVIWGLDIVKHKYLRKIKIEHPQVEAYEIDPLLMATKSLFGTVSKKRFPIIPGAHVPSAGKHKSVKGPAYVYSAIGIGIPENRNINACLLMEDIGHISNPLGIKRREHIIRYDTQQQVINSVLAVGKNHKIKYKEVFVGYKATYVKKGFMGNALVAAPYITLPKHAYPKGEKLVNLTLSEWENKVKNNFLYKDTNK